MPLATPMPTPTSFLLCYVPPELHELAALDLERLLVHRERLTVEERGRRTLEQLGERLSAARTSEELMAAVKGGEG
jgi:hypothetical protein